MTASIRPPKMDNDPDVRAELREIKSYLIYLCNELNFLFSVIPENKDGKENSNGN